MNTVTTTQSEFYILGHGVTLEWQHQKEIYVFTFQMVTPDAVDSYIETYKKLIHRWHSPLPLHVLTVLDSTEGALTAYFRVRLAEIFAMPQFKALLHSRSAFVLQRPFLFSTARLLAYQQIRFTAINDAMQTFFDYNEAVQWLTSSYTSESE